MTEFQKLLSKKDCLLIQIATITQDLTEYINHPVETVCVDQLHYQYDFIIKEIRQIDRNIYELFSKQYVFLACKNKDLKISLM